MGSYGPIWDQCARWAHMSPWAPWGPMGPTGYLDLGPLGPGTRDLGTRAQGPGPVDSDPRTWDPPRPMFAHLAGLIGKMYRIHIHRNYPLE